MKLSMWILNDWLKPYHPEPRIVHGEQTLRSARILSSDTVIERQNVYLASASEFISGEEDRIICVHGQDLILLNTSDMNAVLNSIFDAFDYYNSWADGISEEITSGCDMQRIIDLSHDVFKQPLLVYNTGNEIIGMSSAFPKGSLDPEWDSALETRSNSLDFLVHNQEILKMQRVHHGILRFQAPGTPYPSVYKGLFYDRIWLGRIILLEAFHPLTEGEQQLFDTFGKMAERWAADSYRSDLLKAETGIFQDLMEGRPISPEELDHKLQMAGWAPEDHKQLIRIEIPQQETEILQVLSARLERLFPTSYVIRSHNIIYILSDMELMADPAEDLLEPVLKQTGLYGVSSYPFTNIFRLAEYSEQCTLTSLHCPAAPGNVYSCSDYALDSIHAFLSSKIPGVLKHPGLTTLEQYDRQSHSDLYHTLYIYLRNSCNMAETARQLHLHRNSLLYRLNQIREIAGITLEDPDTREHLLLSFYF